MPKLRPEVENKVISGHLLHVRRERTVGMGFHCLVQVWALPPAVDASDVHHLSMPQFPHRIVMLPVSRC